MPKKNQSRQELSGSLSERAMLVRRETHYWHANKMDKNGAAEFARSKSADPGQFRLAKSLLPKNSLTAIAAAYARGRQSHMHYTLPWRDDGYRILSARLYIDYMRAQQEAKEDIAKAVDAFADRYMELREEGIRLLGDAANHEDYPASREEVRNRYQYIVRVYPLPTAQDFRVGLQQSDADMIRKEIEHDVQEAVTEGLRDPFRRLHEAIGHMIERLNAYGVDSNGKVQGAFRDSLVGNIEQVVSILPDLNIVGDPKMDEMAKRIRETLVVSPTVLRDDEGIRKQTSQEASDILAKLEGFI